MRKIFIIFAFLVSIFNAFAEVMSANDVVLVDNRQSMLDISLSNTSTDIVGLQFNLSLPEGITPVTDGDKVSIEPSSRLRGSYSLRGKRIADGSYLFTFLSNDRTPIDGKSGALFSIALQNTALLPIGSNKANLSGVTVTDLNGNEQSLVDASFSISIIHSYKLTYKVDGAMYKEYTLNYGTLITPEEEPAKEGYTFSGWSEIPANMPAHDVEVNGSFTANKYKVTFISEGTVIKEETLAYGSSITAPANPTKVGHSFTGWNPALDATVPAHDVTYTAQFSVDQYTITFDADGGSYVAPITQNYGTAITKPADPTKEGYTFSGWNPAIPATMPAENMTIKALWTINSYKLTYKVDGAVYKEYTLNYGTAITHEEEPAKEGYTFSGWSEIPANMPAHDIEVSGSFTSNKYKVTFISEGTVIKEETLAYGSSITAPANPTKVGHSFTGWNPAVDTTVPAHDVTYTAQFSIDQYTITFDADGGSYVAPITQNYGTAITKPADPTKEGYTFSGWNPAIPATMPAENMTIKALWTINSYKLTYKVDGAVYKEYTLNYGTAITHEEEPAKEGYTFSGWSEIPANMPAHDIEVSGSFTSNKYKVTFISEGTVIKEETLAYGSSITAPANPTKVGHSFTGWNPALDATVPAHDVTYTAQFSVDQYTITFDADGGSYVAPITQNYGTAITKPADPTKEGYTFSGWNPTIPATMPAENMTIKAQWTINSYKLTYKVDGAVYKEYTLNYGTAITPEAEPTKEGYTFSGWSDIPTNMPAHDVEVNGSFTKGAYQLTYYVDGNKYKGLSYDFGDAITPEAEPAKEGYTFSGWSEIPANMPAHDVEVNGSFTANKYKVTFISEGTVIKEETLAYGSSITAPANPTKVGHSFTGWNPALDATVPAHNVTYTAQFSIDQYTITFDADGGSYVAPITQNYGTAITKPADPTKEGYTFSGWNPAIPATMPAENMTNKAQWTINSYKLTYKVDGAVYKEYTLNYGTAITHEEEPAKEGYTFSGWSEIPANMPAHDVEVNGSFTVNRYKVTFISEGTVIKEETLAYGSSITAPANPTKVGHSFTGWNPEVDATVPAHDVTYTALFSVNQYTITFDADGGSYVAPITQNYGTAIRKPADPTKEGYTFSGWNPAVPENMPAENITIKAQWTINSYKLTYKVDGAVYKEYTLSYGTAITPEEEPTKEGYTFSGWSDIPTNMPTHDVEVNGSFTKGAYQLTYYVDGNKYKGLSYDFGDAITPEAEPAKEGYTFSGWSEIPANMPAHDVEVNGSFTVNMYKVAFISEGTVIKEETLAYGSSITAPANPTKVGHSFTGWNPAVDTTVPAHDVTYTAQFSVDQYTITFDADGGSYVAPITQNYGTAIRKPADPTKEGYTFSGWNPAVPENMPAENITIKAQWTINSYKLTYKVDGAVYKEYTLNYGTLITPEEEPAKEGYTFSGWSEIPANMPAHDIEVSGTFEVNYYKVSYFVGDELVHVDEVAFGEIVELWIYEPEDDALTFKGWIGVIYDKMPAHDISYKADIANGIANIHNNQENVQNIYTLDGKKMEKMHQGVYIVRMKDGSTRKFINKK